MHIMTAAVGDGSAFCLLQAPDGEHFAVVGPDGNFWVGCETFYPAIWNQYVNVCHGIVRQQ